ncbi:UNVERIFIED_CONTAM: hypothetical protein GTU68_066846 [Idotea baltica]|nr:hypothetical protein [Idotea baltica]
MTNATHHQVCSALRRTPPVLRLGIYRERVDAYRTSFSSPSDRAATVSSPANVSRSPLTVSTSPTPIDHSTFAETDPMSYATTNGNNSLRESPKQEDLPDELVHVTLTREVGRQLGIKLGGRRTEPGIFIMELMSGSVAEQDGRLHSNDRILAINGGDVRYERLDYAFRLIKQSQGYVSLIVSRNPLRGEYDHLFKKPHPDLVVAHSRTKSAPDRLVERDQNGRDISRNLPDYKDGFVQTGPSDRSASCESLDEHSNRSGRVSRFHSNGSIISHSKYSNGNSLGSFTDLEPMNQSNNCSLGSLTSGLNKSSRSLTSPLSQFVIEEDEVETTIPPALPPRSRQPLNQTHSFDNLDDSELSNESARDLPSDFDSKDVLARSGGTALPASGCADIVETPTQASRSKSRRSRDCSDLGEITIGMRKSLRIEGNQLHQKTVTISKDASESLGMRIGGGVNSNEGDIPIYIANIHPQGPVGKSKQVKKGDILLSVNGHSLLGLTHTQSVSLLKATAELAGVTLSLLEGSETHTGPANFVPSWLYWQRLPRPLHISKNVLLHRPSGASLGFSIVGGSDPHRGPEPIHVLFVVSTSPAAINGRLRCGDRLLAVDGHCLENVSHATAVSLLKQAGQRVAIEVVSWMGTEL